MLFSYVSSFLPGNSGVCKQTVRENEDYHRIIQSFGGWKEVKMSQYLSTIEALMSRESKSLSCEL